MKVDLTPHPCKWCGDTERTFLCSGCHKYTCRECRLGETEEGCHHKKREPINSQSWDGEVTISSCLWPIQSGYIITEVGNLGLAKE